MEKYTLRIVDNAWLSSFGHCVRNWAPHGGTIPQQVFDRCVRVAGVTEAFRSGASAAPDGGSTADSGEDNGGRPDAEHITIADKGKTIRSTEDLFLKDIPQYLHQVTSDHSTPFLDLMNKTPDVQHILDLVNNPDIQRYSFTENSGEWYVEPAALLPNDGVWTGSGKKKRKVAEAEAQRRANETGIPWRVMRWYGEMGPTLVGLDGFEIRPNDDGYFYQSVWQAVYYPTFSGARERRKRDERMGSKRCRITRTFFPETLTGS